MMAVRHKRTICGIRPELVGGGLIRSLGGWSAFLRSEGEEKNMRYLRELV